MIRTGGGKVPGRRLAFSLALGLMFSAGRPASAPSGAPLWWDLEVRLSAEGSYRMAGGDFSADGGYRFTFFWTGTMERDEADFRLFHNRCDLVRWEAEERSARLDKLIFLSTADFADRPDFNLNFLIQRGDLLVFDLAAQGFVVPVAESPEKFFLLLPSSAENAQSVDGVDYNSKILKGSNRIVLPAETILEGPVEKKFAWDWKNENWLLGRSLTINIIHRHQAKLTLIVRPHYEARVRPDPPPGLGGPPGQALGWKRS